MNLSLTFTDPWLLLLLVLPLLFFFFSRRRGRLLQSFFLAVLAVALAGPVLHGIPAVPRVIALADRSPSIASPAETDALLEALKIEYPQLEVREFTGSTAAALPAAGAEITAPGGGKLIVIGDLLEPSGSIRRSVELLAKRGIPVECRIVPARLNTQPILYQAQLPPAAGTGESAELRLSVDSPDARNVPLTVTDTSGRTVLERELALHPGDHTYSLPLPMRREGLQSFSVHLAQNAPRTIAAWVRPPYPALLFAADPDRARAALEPLLGRGVRFETANRNSDSSHYPLTVIVEEALDQLTEEVQARIAAAVRNGSGCLIFTGRQAPFAGRTAQPEFEAMLPVRWEGRNLVKNPSISLVIIIDTSGSMSGPRIDLAREVARLALGKLRDFDLAGIVEFHGNRRWAAPLQSAANHLELQRALNRLNAGGGTVILPAVHEAYYALRNADTRLKHVLIITDGGVEHGDFETPLRLMTRHDITLSTVMVGNGSGDFLSSLALLGGGRFYRATSRFLLPELSFDQSGRNAQPSFVEDTFPLQPEAAFPEMEQPFPASLTAGGLLRGRAADGAETLLSADGMPFWAAKRHGLGGVLAINSELAGPWSSEAAADPVYQAALAGITRRLPDAGHFGKVTAVNRSLNRDLEFRFEAGDGTDELQLELTGENGIMEQFRLNRSADGSFRFSYPQLPAGIRQLRTMPGGDRFAVAIEDAPELKSLAADRELAEALNKRAAKLPAPEINRVSCPLRAWLGAGALLLFLLQLLYRRRPGRFAPAVGALLLLAPAAFAAETRYEAELREEYRLEAAGDHAAASTAAERAAALAETDSDRRFALLLQFENARRSGRLPALLEKWSGAADPVRLALVLNQWEEQGEFEKAFGLLNRHIGELADRDFQLQWFRLAEKTGRTEAARRRYREQADREQGSFNWFSLGVEFELLAGNRPEAEALIRDRIQRENSAGALLEIAAVAGKSALYLLAETAAQKGAKIDPAQRYFALFFLAELRYRRGDPTAAVRELLDAVAGTGTPPGILMNAADYCERFGDRKAALALLLRAGAGDAEIRAAMLEEELDNPAGAELLYRKIMEHSPGEMRARQAMDRLLAIRRKAGKVAELKAEEEAKHPPLTMRDIVFRTMIYMELKEIDAMRAFLYKQSLPGLEQLELNFLLEAKRYPDAVRMIRDRIAGDSAQREEGLRQLTIIAVESNDASFARECADELLKITTNRAAGLEFAGGVAMLTKDYPYAASCYEEAAALAPDRIELHLLRANALKATGRREEALSFFRGRLHPGIAPDEFGVMIDGLLNLEAPPALLEEALQNVFARIAADRDQLFYYRLAEDLAQELRKDELFERLRREQMIFAPERRTLLLTEAFSEAILRRDAKAGLFYGRLLTGLGELLPPETEQKFGQLLLEANLPLGAERCFRAADMVSGNTIANRLTFAAACRELGRLDDAARLLRELLIIEPENPALLLEHGMLLESRGHPAEAAQQYLDAFRLIVTRSGETTQKRRTGASEFETYYTPLLRALANQAAVAGEPVETAIGEYAAQSRPEQWKHWNTLQLRIDQLKGVAPLPGSTGNAARRPLQISPMTKLLNELRQASDTEYARLLKGGKAYFLRLPNHFDFEPDRALEDACLEFWKSFPERKPPATGWSDTPYGGHLRLRLAEAILEENPEDENAVLLAAEQRHRNGKALSARLLTGDVLEKYKTQGTLTFPEFNRLRRALRLFRPAPGEPPAEAAEALKELQDSFAADIRIFGVSPVKLLYSGLLSELSGDFDRAMECYRDGWRLDPDSMVLQRQLSDAAEITGRLEELCDILQEKEPKDNVARILYFNRLVPLLRGLHHFAEAELALGGLNPALRSRERILLDLESGSAGRLRPNLLRYMQEQRNRNGMFHVGFLRENAGGIQGYLVQRERKRTAILDEILRRQPELAKELLPLLRGTRPDENGYAGLLRALAGSGNKWSEVFPGSVMLQVLSGHPAEPAELQKFAADPALSSSLRLELIRALPEGPARSEIAAGLAEEVLAGTRRPDTFQPLHELLTLTEPEKRSALLTALAGQESDAAEMDRLLLLNQFTPELFEQRSALLRRNGLQPGSELDLAIGTDHFRERLRRCLRFNAAVPPWDAILPLLNAEERESFPESVREILEEAGRTLRLSPAKLVRHYAFAGYCDQAERRSFWIENAMRHHHKHGEESLWLLDLLPPDRDSYRLLFEQLSTEKRLPPSRRSDLPQPKP